MQLQTAHTEFRRLLSMPRCPACGASVIAAQASEFIDTGEIRHHWTCDDCGQTFSTTVTLD